MMGLDEHVEYCQVMLDSNQQVAVYREFIITRFKPLANLNKSPYVLVEKLLGSDDD